MDYLKPTTEVDGLFLTGQVDFFSFSSPNFFLCLFMFYFQDVATCGIAGALMGGVLTSLASSFSLSLLFLFFILLSFLCSIE